MRIASVGRALPPHFYDQETLIAAFRAHWGQRHHNMDRLEALHRNVLVGGRNLALPMEEYPKLDSFGAANDAWIRVAMSSHTSTFRSAMAGTSAAVNKSPVSIPMKSTTSDMALELLPSIERSSPSTVQSVVAPE